MPEKKLLFPLNQLTLPGCVGVDGIETLGLRGSSSRFSSAFSSKLKSAIGGLTFPPAIPINSPQYLIAGIGKAPLYLLTVLVHHVSDNSFMRLKCLS